MSNGYSSIECDRGWLSVSRDDEVEEQNLPRHSIPYVRGLSEKLTSILREVNVRTSMKPSTTLRSLLVHKRPEPAKILGSVYKLPCGEEGCSWVYAGETSRPVEERLKEHAKSIKSMDVQRSEVAKHAVSSGHPIRVKNATVIDRESSWSKRIVKESLWTHKLHSENKVKHTLSDVWKS